MNAVTDVIDFNELTKGMICASNKTLGSLVTVYDIVEQMRGIPFPPGYIDTLRDEMLSVLKTGIPTKPTFVYLAFYGFNGRATHLKIGVAKDVKARMASIRTGNPLQNLWTYTAAYSTKPDALRVEAALLAHMSSDSVHGEWVSVGLVSDKASAAIVGSLNDVAEAVAGCRINFRLSEV